MKVLIVSHYFPPHVGGIEIVAENQAKHLAKHGHKVEVLTSAINFKKGRHEHLDNYVVHRVPAWNYFEKNLGVPFPIYSVKLLSTGFKLVRKADVVHVHDAFYLSSFVAAFWAWVFRKPLILTQHVATIPHPKKIVGWVQWIVYRTTGRFIFHTSRKVIVYNSRVQNFLVEHYVNADKIASITNGTNLELFSPATSKQKRLLRKKYKLPTQKHLALFVGRFVPKKGFNKLVAAGSQQYTIVFAGGKMPPQYKDDKRFVFVGSLSQTELADIYKACDLFVLPSEGEGFPLSIQEAMASGLPIVTTDDEGYSFHNFNRKLFRLIQPTIEEVKIQLEAIAKDEQLRKDMSEYSLDYARKYFNWDRAVKQMTRIYQDSMT